MSTVNVVAIVAGWSYIDPAHPDNVNIPVLGLYDLFGITEKDFPDGIFPPPVTDVLYFVMDIRKSLAESFS